MTLCSHSKTKMQMITPYAQIQRLFRRSFLSYPILSYPILSYPILSCPVVLSCPILSYPILSYPICIKTEIVHNVLLKTDMGHIFFWDLMHSPTNDCFWHSSPREEGIEGQKTNKIVFELFLVNILRNKIKICVAISIHCDVKRWWHLSYMPIWVFAWY